MFKLGFSQNELIAKNVCTKITSVLDSPRYGEERAIRKEIAIRSAEDIILKIRKQMHDENLVMAIEAELQQCHEGIDWKFHK